MVRRTFAFLMVFGLVLGYGLSSLGQTNVASAASTLLHSVTINDDPQNNPADWRIAAGDPTLGASPVAKPTCDTIDGNNTHGRDKAAYDANTIQSECVDQTDITQAVVSTFSDPAWRGGGFMQVKFKVSGAIPTPGVTATVDNTENTINGVYYKLDFQNPRRQNQRQTDGSSSACDRFTHIGPYFTEDNEYYSVYYTLNLKANGEVDPATHLPIGLWQQDEAYGFYDTIDGINHNNEISQMGKVSKCPDDNIIATNATIENSSGTLPFNFEVNKLNDPAWSTKPCLHNDTDTNPATANCTSPITLGDQDSAGYHSVTIKIPFVWRNHGCTPCRPYDYTLMKPSDLLHGLRVSAYTIQNVFSVAPTKDPTDGCVLTDGVNDLNPAKGTTGDIFDSCELLGGTYLQGSVFQDWAPWASYDLGDEVQVNPFPGDSIFGPTCPEYTAQTWLGAQAGSSAGVIRITKQCTTGSGCKDPDTQISPFYAPIGESGLSEYDAATDRSLSPEGYGTAPGEAATNNPFISQARNSLHGCFINAAGIARYVRNGGPSLTV